MANDPQSVCGTQMGFTETGDMTGLVGMAYGLFSQNAIARGVAYPLHCYEQMLLSCMGSFTGPRHIDKLVKFFPDKTTPEGRNYSRQALKHQTVYLADPRMFNDPYDCVIGYDEDAAIQGMVDRFAREFSLDIDGGINLAESIDELAAHLNRLAPESMPTLKALCGEANGIWSHLAYYNMLLDMKQRGLSSFDAKHIDGAVRGKLDEIGRIMDLFGVSCFTSTVENTYMWGHYADGFSGFAIEYDLSPIQSSQKLGDNVLKVASNMWDVFYVKNRLLLTKEVVEYLTSDINGEWLRLLYVKALCTKGIDWAFENESRLIMPIKDEYVVQCKRNIPFLPAKKVYLGQRMGVDAKKAIQDICRGLSPEPQVFEMLPRTDSFVPQFREL